MSGGCRVAKGSRHGGLAKRGRLSESGGSRQGAPVTGPSAQQSFKSSQSLSIFATPPCLAATLVDTCDNPVAQPPHSTPPLSTTFGPRQASLSTPCPNSTSLGCKAGSPPAVQKRFLGRRPSNRGPLSTPTALAQPSLLRQASMSTTLRYSTTSTHGGPSYWAFGPAIF